MDLGAVEVSDEVERIGEEENARDASTRRPRELMPAGPPENPYDLEEPVSEPASPVSHSQAAERAAAMSDPYGEPSEAEDVREVTGPGTQVDEDTRIAVGRPSAPASSQPASSPIDTAKGPHAMLLPYNIGLARIKTPLRDVATEDLGKALAFARNVGKYAELVDAISIVLDDRRHGDAAEPGA
jgi:hypothetical protein